MEYKFNKNNKVQIDIVNDEGCVKRNDKCLYDFKGQHKLIECYDKNGNLISLTIRIKSPFENTYYIALTENEDFIRTSLITIFPFLIGTKNKGKFKNFLKLFGGNND